MTPGNFPYSLEYNYESLDFDMNRWTVTLDNLQIASCPFNNKLMHTVMQPVTEPGMDWTPLMMRSGKTTPYLSKINKFIWVITWHHMEYYNTKHMYPKRQNMIKFTKNGSHFEFKDGRHIFYNCIFIINIH